MKEPTERTPSLSSGSEENAEKSAKEIDPPPAYSLAAFCTKRKTNWNPTLVIATAVVSALLVALLIGGLLFKIERLNGALAERDARISEQKAMLERLGELCEVKEAEWKSGQQSKESKEEEPGAEIRECWSRVSNLTKELAVHKQEAAARISRLEAEAGRLNVELLNATFEASRLQEEVKELVNEKAEWTKKNDQLVEQRPQLTIKTEKPEGMTTATTELPFNSTSNATAITNDSECSTWFDHAVLFI
ncbi:hypothetical protein M3Y99_01342600 [Aphelenchoides fujianensis]|nr:hypothetical protein M3Y99_01342600 [Aphelenchoides fujianensis]